MNRNIQNNIIRLYIIKIAKWFSLIMPIVVLFFQEQGLTMSEIFILKSAYSIGIVAFEIPSGYLADIWGRKKTLLIGSIFITLGFSFYGFSSLFWEFLIAELILGIGQSCISGADSAMLYDTLKSEKKEAQYLKYEGRVTSVGNFAEAFAGIIGGLLATITLRTPYYAQIFVAALAIPASLTLVEPNVKRKISGGWKDIMSVLHKTLIVNSRLRNFIFFSSIVGTATLSFAWFIQPFLIEIEMPVGLFGVTWTILNLTVGIASVLAFRIERNLSERNATALLFSLIAIGFIATGLTMSYFSLFIIFSTYLVRGIASPVLKDYIHSMIESDVRATILSLRDMFIRIIFAFIGPVFGWIIDTYGLKNGFYFAGVFFLFSGAVLHYFLYRHNTTCKPS
jgi:MFS family permease